MQLPNPSKGWSSSTSRLLALYSFLFVTWSCILMGVLYYEVSDYLNKLTRHSMLQRQHLLGAACFVADQIQFEVGHLQRGGLSGDAVLAAQQHFHARGHFVGGERLGQVIIAASPQAAHTLVDIGERADHQNRRGHAHGAQGGDDGQAIEFRQHAVEGNQVVVTTDRTVQTFAAIVDPIHFQAVAAEFGNDFTGSHGVVFDGQNTSHRAGLDRFKRDGSILPSIFRRALN